MMVDAITERGRVDRDVNLRCDRARRRTHGALMHALARAKARGEVPDDLDLDATATMLLTQVYGLAVLGKAGVPATELHASVEAALRNLG